MSNWVETTAKTVEQAVEQALATLACTEDDVVIEVLDEGESGGLLGFGRKPARVRVTRIEDADQELETMPQDFFYEDDAVVVEEEEEEDDKAEKSFDSGTITHQVEEATLDYVQAILQGIGIHGRLGSYITEDGNLHIEVTGRDCGPAIGHHGETLDAISYLTGLVANRVSEEHVRVAVDIGGYRRRREQKLIDMAQSAARRAERNQEAVQMKPMPAHERRIVHLAIKDLTGVVTQSEGVEPDRYVVILPASQG